MNVLTLTSPDIENGLGCRVTIWVAGCNRKCPGCHNPHTWSYNQGKPLLSEDVMNKIFNECSYDYIRGLTISGGDPLDQDEKSLGELFDFIKIFKSRFPKKDIWIYSGGVYEDLIKNPTIKAILSECDVLVDGPFIQSKKELDLSFCGSSNQRIIFLNKTR